MRVRPGQLDGFVAPAAECVRLTRVKDTRTLRYDWYLSTDGTRCDVRETYAIAEGLVEHRANVGPALERPFARYADHHTMTVYDDPDPKLLELADRSGISDQITWFTCLAGLRTGQPHTSQQAAVLGAAGGPAPDHQRPMCRLGAMAAAASRLPCLKMSGTMFRPLNLRALMVVCLLFAGHPADILPERSRRRRAPAASDHRTRAQSDRWWGYLAVGRVRNSTRAEARCYPRDQ